MKRFFSCVICALLLLSCLTGCKKEPEYYSEWISVYETLPAESEETVSDKETANTERKSYPSTIATPTSIEFYKGGMRADSKDKTLRKQIATHIEKWFYDYENDTLPIVDMKVTKQLIWENRLNEMVIELNFGSSTQGAINFLGKISLEKTYEIQIPLTGKYAYYVFSGTSGGEYQNKPYNLKGSGLEQYFEGITLDKKVRDWQSTIIAPATVTFYKDGASTVSTDKELNHKIAKHIEAWFKYKETGIGLSLAANTDTLRPIKQNEMAVELEFDNEILFYGNAEFRNSRTLFIPVTGEYKNIIFHNRINNPDSWTGPIYGGSGLDQYFQYVQFTPLTEEEKRWRSTVSSASTISAYEGETLLGESSSYGLNYPFNYEIMQHIEKWFYHKEDIKRVDTGITDVSLSVIRAKEKYLEMYLGFPDPTFYGQYVISEKSSYILIPLTGEYAYHIFEGNYKNYSPIAIVTEGSGLEEYFEAVKAKGVDDDPQDKYEMVEEAPEEY
ncbi:MAG: hypothetical protein IJZ75_04705 [Clostridia bacterium]|nr:hypothetical protein [Clostridia bacterium]